MKKKESPPSFEEALTRLNRIVELLELDETTIEESLALYEEGVGLLDHCMKHMNAAQDKMRILRSRADGLFEVSDAAIENGTGE